LAVIFTPVSYSGISFSDIGGNIYPCGIFRYKFYRYWWQYLPPVAYFGISFTDIGGNIYPL